jgi:hypothetical protein
MMTIREEHIGLPAGTRAASMAGIRRQSFAMCVLLLVQYGLGIGVNLFVTLPGQDHGAGLGAAIANGPVAVSIHAVLGLALIVVALATAVRAALIRHGGVIALAVAGLAALTSAAINGIRFVGTGQNGASMAMALGWAVALLCYVSIMYVAGRPARR